MVRHITICFSCFPDLTTEYLDFGRGGHLTSSRTKRMRTSFKHHQLRTMKSYFAVNHNPDAKDLKQLSQKTGLPKRVLQVNVYSMLAGWMDGSLQQIKPFIHFYVQIVLFSVIERRKNCLWCFAFMVSSWWPRVYFFLWNGIIFF